MLRDGGVGPVRSAQNLHPAQGGGCLPALGSGFERGGPRHQLIPLLGWYNRSRDEGSSGFTRQSHIDRAIGAVHTAFGTCELAADGAIAPHVHSYEELIYVLEGHPRLSIDGLTHELAADDAAFIGVGTVHSWTVPSSEACRWIELQTPQARGPARHVLC